MSQPTPEYVRESGGSVISRNILEGRGRLRWAVREAAVTPVDNGWRFFSEIDDEAFLADPANFAVVGFNTVVAIEPAVLPILYMPVGTDLVIKRDAAGRFELYDNATGRPRGHPGL